MPLEPVLWQEDGTSPKYLKRACDNNDGRDRFSFAVKMYFSGGLGLRPEAGTELARKVWGLGFRV